MDQDTTIVIFRKWSKKEGGDVLALFPYEPGDMSPYTCSSYQHIGQHGAADDRSCVLRTKPAKPEDFADLKRELETIGYKLEIRQRIPSDAINVRRSKLG